VQIQIHRYGQRSRPKDLTSMRYCGWSCVPQETGGSRGLSEGERSQRVCIIIEACVHKICSIIRLHPRPNTYQKKHQKTEPKPALSPNKSEPQITFWLKGFSNESLSVSGLRSRLMTRLIIMPKLDNDGVWSQKYFDSFTLSPRVLYDTLIIGQRCLLDSLRFV